MSHHLPPSLRPYLPTYLPTSLLASTAPASLGSQAPEGNNNLEGLVIFPDCAQAGAGSHPTRLWQLVPDVPLLCCGLSGAASAARPTTFRPAASSAVLGIQPNVYSSWQCGW